MSQADDELDRQAEQLAQHFDAQGNVVTWRLEVDVNCAAKFLDVSPLTMRQWRVYGAGRHGVDGPRCRVHAGRAWYSIRGLLEWIERKQGLDACVMAADPESSSDPAPGGTRT